MLKRLRWLFTGLAIGAGSSIWAQRKVRSVTSRYRPSGIANSATTRALGVPGDLRAALREGRQAMRAREAELRAGQTRPGS
jgi:hypothetical protein